MNVLEELKRDVDLLSFAVAKVAEQFDYNAGEVFSSVKADMALAMLNLAATDGYFDVKEAYAIGEVIGVNMSQDEMMAVIKNNNFPSVEELQRVPGSLKILCSLDAVARERGEESNLAKALLDVYNRLFILTVVADGAKEDIELQAHAVFMQTMIDYVKANS